MSPVPKWVNSENRNDMLKPITLQAAASEHIRPLAYLKLIEIVKSLSCIRNEFFLYMGQIPCVDSLSDTRSCGGPPALGQQAQLLPCLPARRLASWRPPRPKPWSPALKTTYLPLVRANTSSVHTIHISRGRRMWDDQKPSYCFYPSSRCGRC